MSSDTGQKRGKEGGQVETRRSAVSLGAIKTIVIAEHTNNRRQVLVVGTAVYLGWIDF